MEISERPNRALDDGEVQVRVLDMPGDGAREGADEGAQYFYILDRPDAFCHCCWEAGDPEPMYIVDIGSIRGNGDACGHSQAKKLLVPPKSHHPLPAVTAFQQRPEPLELWRGKDEIDGELVRDAGWNGWLVRVD